MQTRKQPRKPIAVRGQVRSERGMHWEVDLVDLSTGGCRFPEPGAQLAKGERVSLYLADAGPYRAHVSWRRGKDIGVAFDQPLPQALIDRLLSRGPTDAASGSQAPVRRPC